MKIFRIVAVLFLSACIAFVGTGCGKKKHAEGDGDEHGKEEAHGKDDGHGHSEEAPAGASFKPGTGVIVTEETRKIIGLEVADVLEEKLPQQIQFTVQIYGTGVSNGVPASHHNEVTKASGMVSQNKGDLITPGRIVELVSKSGATGKGTVAKVHRTLTVADPEIDIALNDAGSFQPGEFINATITIPRDEAVAVVPKSALLRSSEGIFVYAVNGEAFFRTAVKIGAEANGKVEISDGLLAGDQVVTKPIETLWLIELRATKGGGHSH